MIRVYTTRIIIWVITVGFMIPALIFQFRTNAPDASCLRELQHQKILNILHAEFHTSPAHD